MAIGMVAALALCAATAYAFLVMRGTKTPPNPALSEAYETALRILGPETNTFYCLRADAMTISDTQGSTEWHLIFYSTNGQLREVIVPTSGKVIVRDKLRDSY